MTTLRAPFPYFGGKSRVAHIIWSRFGDVPNYVEPFFGSGAILLSRPHIPQLETINDLDCMVANFWRALIAEPESVADFADAPINEADFSAKHKWIHSQIDFREKMRNDPDYYDPKIAGWWVWGKCLAIGGGWQRDEYNSMPTTNMQGINARYVLDVGLQQTLYNLAIRLRYVRVLCGDWSRGMVQAVNNGKLTGILFDPPYFDGLSDDLYRHSDSNVSSDVRQWALDNGNNPELRIALCGYEGEHPMPDTWEKVSWKATGGYGSQRRDGTNDNNERERIWFSPACLKVNDSLFTDEEDEE